MMTSFPAMESVIYSLKSQLGVGFVTTTGVWTMTGRLYLFPYFKKNKGPLDILLPLAVLHTYYSANSESKWVLAANSDATKILTMEVSTKH